MNKRELKSSSNLSIRSCRPWQQFLQWFSMNCLAAAAFCLVTGDDTATSAADKSKARSEFRLIAPSLRVLSPPSICGVTRLISEHQERREQNFQERSRKLVTMTEHSGKVCEEEMNWRIYRSQEAVLRHMFGRLTFSQTRTEAGSIVIRPPVGPNQTVNQLDERFGIFKRPNAQ